MLHTLDENPDTWDIVEGLAPKSKWEVAFAEVQLKSKRSVGQFKPRGLAVKLRRRKLWPLNPNSPRRERPGREALEESESSDEDAVRKEDLDEELNIDDGGEIFVDPENEDGKGEGSGKEDSDFARSLFGPSESGTDPSDSDPDHTKDKEKEPDPVIVDPAPPTPQPVEPPVEEEPPVVVDEDSAPPPLVPVVQRKRIGPGVRCPEENQIDIGHGTIRYMSHSKRYIAQCSHGLACYKSRVSHEGPRKGQGRPLGYLSAWLLYPILVGECSLEEHLQVGVQVDDLDYEFRVDAREDLLAIKGAEEGLFKYEDQYEQVGPRLEHRNFR